MFIINKNILKQFQAFKYEIAQIEFDESTDEEVYPVFKIFFIKEAILDDSTILTDDFKNMLLKDVDLNCLPIDYTSDFSEKMESYVTYCLEIDDEEFCNYVNNLTIENCLKTYDNLWSVYDVDPQYKIPYKVAEYYIQKNTETLNNNDKEKVLNLIKNHYPHHIDKAFVDLFGVIKENKKGRLNKFSYYDAQLSLLHKYFTTVGFENITKDNLDEIGYVLTCMNYSTMLGENYKAFILYYLMDRLDVMDIIQFFKDLIGTKKTLSSDNVLFEDYKFINYVDNYEDYKNMPLSWVLELCN